MTEQSDAFVMLKWLFEHYEVVGLYGLKILSDIRKDLHNHSIDIAVIKYALGINKIEGKEGESQKS